MNGIHIFNEIGKIYLKYNQMLTLDSGDKQILATVAWYQQQGELPIAEDIIANVRISRASVYRKVKVLEQKGFLKRYFVENVLAHELTSYVEDFALNLAQPLQAA